MIQLIDFHFDFETRSRAELGTVGSVKYSLDPSTEATLLTWAFNRTGSVKAWRKGRHIPEDLIDVAKNPWKYRFIAWNIQFDYLIWCQVFSKIMPAPLIRPAVANLEDAMAVSCHFRSGGSLESAAQMTGQSYSKDKVGRQLMLKQCKPNTRTGEFIELTDAEWVDFERYGMVDTRLLRDVYYKLPPLPPMERYAWEWTFRRNLQGIRFDENLVKEFNDIVEANKPSLVAEFDHLVCGYATIGSPVKCKEYFKHFYPWIENMQADTVRDMLAEDPARVPWYVRRALEIKDLAGGSSLSKISSIMLRAFNGRIYETLAYHWAGTKRWAGRGPQIHNFPRVDGTLLDNYFDSEKPNYKPFDLNVLDLTWAVRQLRPDLKDPLGFVKNMLRRVWLPEPGNQFYCGDFSKIEPTVLFWLVGLGPIPKKWYEEMASEIYAKPVSEISKESQERQIGKTAALSCGYGAGWKSFITKTYEDTGIRLTEETSKTVINAYRRKYAPVTQFWNDLQVGFRKAIYGESSSLCNGKIHIMPMQYPWKGVQIRLPSGSYLYYHQACEKTEEVEEEIVELRNGVTVKYKVKKMKTSIKYLDDQGQGRVGWEYLYGGKLCENVVSATARDVLVPAMWRLEEAGFAVLATVHDELWGDAAPGRDEEFNRLMCINPSWCPDMVIGSDLKVGVRYLK